MNKNTYRLVTNSQQNVVELGSEYCAEHHRYSDRESTAAEEERCHHSSTTTFISIQRLSIYSVTGDDSAPPPPPPKMNRALSRLIPARFLSLVVHLVIIICVMTQSDANVRACLPSDYDAGDYDARYAELMTGMGLAVGLIGVELLGFLAGVTMFRETVALLSTCAHATAAVALAYFVLDAWDCHLYWWVFALCSAVPGVLEVALFVSFCLFEK